MKWTEIPSGQINGAFQRLMVAFGDQADGIVERINTDDTVATRVASLCRNGGFELSTNQARAKEIMGTNFFGLEEAMKHFGMSFSKRQIAYMSEIPFSETTLQACKDTHILVAVMPLSIVQIRSYATAMRLPKSQKSFFYSQDWYDSQAFANERGKLEWQLVRKTPVSDSLSKTWSQQQALLDGKIEETPKAQIMVYTIIGHFLATGERLFEKLYVRCSDLDSDGNRVGVGGFGADGLVVDYYNDDSVGGSLGVSSSRKLES
jgi:hypothetical protein